MRCHRGGPRRREALIILIALPDALDQYFFRHPDDFFSRSYEATIVDPGNPQILAAHLVAAASEVPLRSDNSFYAAEKDLIQSLADQRRLLLSADGTEWYARERHPQRRINIRSLGEACANLEPAGRAIGTIDGILAVHECHPGAIYLHQGQQCETLRLDLIQHKIHARPVTVDYCTAPLIEKDTKILQILQSRDHQGIPYHLGRLTKRGFQVLPELFLTTRQLLEECPCEAGCPSCVHSPKCGSGNKPFDKHGAHLTLKGLLGEAPWADATQPVGRPSTTTSDPLVKQESEIAAAESHAIVFDLETQRSAEDVGGWEHRQRMGLAVGVIYDLDRAEFHVYTERQVDALITELVQARLIVGFNLRRFDFDVLRGYTDLDWDALPALDILECVYRRLGFRLKLDHLAQETLGERKSADGLQSLAWFKAGEIERVIEYCKHDVLLTKRLYDFGRQHGYLLYRDNQGRAVRLPVDFDENLFARQPK